jgi:predicted AAA+ superfamily ATPase
LSSNIPTKLKSKAIPIFIYPLSYLEISKHSRYKNKNEMEILQDYMRFGGMPGRLTFENNEQINEYLKLIFSSVLEIDIISKKNIADISELKRIYYYVLNNIGKKISILNIKDYLKTHNNSNSSIDKISNYLS